MSLTVGVIFGRFAKAESWVYRGQANADWELIPSALRQSQRNNLFHAARLEMPKSDSNVNQWLAEATVLQLFHEYADLSASPIPEDSQSVRNQLSSLTLSYSIWTNGYNANERSH